MEKRANDDESESRKAKPGEEKRSSGIDKKSRGRARALSPEYFCICMQFSSCSARTEERNGFTIRLNAYAPRYSGWFRKTIRRLPREWLSKNHRVWCLRAAHNDSTGKKINLARYHLRL